MAIFKVPLEKMAVKINEEKDGCKMEEKMAT